MSIELARNTLTMAQVSIVDGILHRHFIQKHPQGREGHLVQLAVPRLYVTRVLELNHDEITGGHIGINHLYAKMRLEYYWPGIYGDIRNYVRSCGVCSPKNTPEAPLLPIPVGEAFERVGVDVIGPMKRSRSGNKYIICFTDYLTKWAEAFPIRHQKTDLIADILVNQIIFRHGAPSGFLNDRGKNFLSKIVSQTCQFFPC